MPEENQSIHPRVVKGRTFYEKVNTSRPPSQEKRARTLAAIRKHLESHPRDAASARRADALAKGPVPAFAILFAIVCSIGLAGEAISAVLGLGI